MDNSKCVKWRNSKKTFQLRSIGRWFRYKYLQLTRAKGGPALVAMGFSIGIFVEMFTLPTGGLAFLLIFPLVYLLRASVASALLGFMFGKVIYLPLMFFFIARWGRSCCLTAFTALGSNDCRNGWTDS